LQTQGIDPVRNKPVDELKNQKGKKCISCKSKMDLKVPNHDQATRSGAVLKDTVCELQAREHDETKKVKGG
jgi:hypothetical protein